MADFRTMFPKLDPDVIEAVLRANNGVVESTIDHLLKLNEGNEESRDQLEQKQQKSTPSDLLPPSYDAATAAERHAAKAAEAGVGVIDSIGARPSSSSSSSSSHPRHQSKPLAAAAAATAASAAAAGVAASPGGATAEEGATGGGYRNWKPPLLGALPEDFLRLTTGRGIGNRAGGRCRNCGRHHHHHRHHHRHTSARRPAGAAAGGGPMTGAVGGGLPVMAKAATLATGSAVSEMDTVVSWKAGGKGKGFIRF